MDVRYGREITVGTIVLIAVAVFVVGTMWLSGKSLGGGQRVLIAFRDVGTLKNSSPVRIAGVPVGKVEGFKLVSRDQVLVTVTVPGEYRPRTDARAKVISVGLAGDAAIAYDPGTSSDFLPDDTPVEGGGEPALTDRALQLSDRADSVLLNVQRLTDSAMQRQFISVLKNLDQTLDATRRAMQIYADREKGPSAELEKTLAEFRGLAARMDSTLSAPAVVRARDQADTVVRNLSEMTAQFRATGARLDTLLAAVNRGEGTLGKLKSDSALYQRTVSLIESMDSLVTQLRRQPGRIGITVKAF